MTDTLTVANKLNPVAVIHAALTDPQQSPEELTKMLRAMVEKRFGKLDDQADEDVRLQYTAAIEDEVGVELAQIGVKSGLALRQHVAEFYRRGLYLHVPIMRTNSPVDAQTGEIATEFYQDFESWYNDWAARAGLNDSYRSTIYHGVTKLLPAARAGLLVNEVTDDDGQVVSRQIIGEDEILHMPVSKFEKTVAATTNLLVLAGQGNTEALSKASQVVAAALNPNVKSREFAEIRAQAGLVTKSRYERATMYEFVVPGGRTAYLVIPETDMEERLFLNGAEARVQKEAMDFDDVVEMLASRRRRAIVDDETENITDWLTNFTPKPDGG
jgi:hypothetical protein